MSFIYFPLIHIPLVIIFFKYLPVKSEKLKIIETHEVVNEIACKHPTNDDKMSSSEGSEESTTSSSSSEDDTGGKYEQQGKSCKYIRYACDVIKFSTLHDIILTYACVFIYYHLIWYRCS